MFKKGKKGIVFDWDGTLFDSMSYKRDNFVKLYTDMGVSILDVTSLHQELSGLPRKELFSKLYSTIFDRELSEEKFKQLSSEYTKLNIKSSSKSKVFLDVKPTIEALTPKSLLFVSSSSPHNELSKVCSSQLINTFFHGIYGSRTGFRKGYEHFDYIKTECNIQYDEMLFIGDDEQDALLAGYRNVDFVRIQRNGIIPKQLKHQCISSLTELVSLLDT